MHRMLFIWKYGHRVCKKSLYVSVLLKLKSSDFSWLLVFLSDNILTIGIFLNMNFTENWAFVLPPENEVVEESTEPERLFMLGC